MLCNSFSVLMGVSLGFRGTGEFVLVLVLVLVLHHFFCCVLPSEVFRVGDMVLGVMGLFAGDFLSKLFGFLIP